MTPERIRTWLFAPAILVAAASCMYADSAEAPDDTEELADGAVMESGVPAAAQTPALPRGTALTFVLEETVSTNTHGVGDEFLSTLTADAISPEGMVILPAGTIGTWVVVESTSDNGDGEAVLAVRLQGLQTQAGWQTVDATVVASDLKIDEKDSDAETAAKIGIGTAAGALLGRVLGDDGSDALKGAGVGAAMGTAVALATRGGSAELRVGSTVTVSLDRSLRAER